MVWFAVLREYCDYITFAHFKVEAAFDGPVVCVVCYWSEGRERKRKIEKVKGECVSERDHKMLGGIQYTSMYYLPPSIPPALCTACTPLSNPMQSRF